MAVNEDHIVRDLLTAIEDDSNVSQRTLAKRIGIAVGSVNWYLNRCVNKGLIKLHQVPARRYLYYLTPQGVEEKARLSASFLRSSLELFRKGRKECAAFFQACGEVGRSRIFLAGDGDLAEIAVLSSLDSGVRPAGIIDADSPRTACLGVPVVASLKEATALVGGAPDAILLTDLDDPKSTFEIVRSQTDELGLPRDTITIPKLLAFRPDP